MLAVEAAVGPAGFRQALVLRGGLEIDTAI